MTRDPIKHITQPLLVLTRPLNTVIHSIKHIPHNVFYRSDLLSFLVFSLTLSKNVSLSRPAGIPLLKLPWLCIKDVLLNSDLFSIINLAKNFQ
ncbi:unnamed protein product [Caenorhabditis brenneri]